MEIENALIRLREATAEINRATNDSRTKSVLEKTWILQDRLMFPNQVRLVKYYLSVVSAADSRASISLTRHPRIEFGHSVTSDCAVLFMCVGRTKKAWMASTWLPSCIKSGYVSQRLTASTKSTPFGLAYLWPTSVWKMLTMGEVDTIFPVYPSSALTV